MVGKTRFFLTGVRGIWLLATLGALACEQTTPIVRSLCREDTDCEAGLICENFECVEASTKSCDVVIDGNPILQSSPHNVPLGEIDVTETTRSLKLHNIGNCTLTIFEVNLASKSSQGFSCTSCATTKFPIEIFPNRERTLDIKFTGTTPGKYKDELIILSDDRQYPEMRIPLSVNFLGTTDLRVIPYPIDFGYVADNLKATKSIQITNQGTGTATVEIQGYSIAPSTAPFSVGDKLIEATKLYPIDSEFGQSYDFDLTYYPRNRDKHAAELVIQTSKGEVRVPISGNSLTPPKMNVPRDPIDLGQVPLGGTQIRPLTISNEGGVPLTVDYSWGGVSLSTDLFGIPALLTPIAPGAYTELQVAVTATKLGPIKGILILKSNDPNNAQVSIPVTAEGVPGAGPEVVKLELNYENGSDSAFDEDFRNVDMTLENPFSSVCNKQYPAPQDWGNFGKPTWISFGPKGEPERIVLVNSTQDGKYRVMLQYMQSCSSLPTSLLSGLLGVAVDVAQLAAAGVVVVDGKDVGKLIETVCLKREGTNATVKVYVNGNLVKEVSTRLNKLGDVVYPLELTRLNGTFTVQ